MYETLQGVNVFLTYSHDDARYRENLGKHLKLLERKGDIVFWHDREITPGEDWGIEISHHLSKADIILALVSSSFLNSDYCYDIELKSALANHNSGRSRLIPIIVRPVSWSDSPLGTLQALPANGKPVSTWSDEDEAWLNVVQGVIKVTRSIHRQKQAFLDGLPRALMSFVPNRAKLISVDDNAVNRNISRLRNKNKDLWQRVEKYRAEVRIFSVHVEKGLEEIYDAIFSNMGAVLCNIVLFELFEAYFNSTVEELTIVEEVEKSDQKPALFGLQSSSAAMKEVAESAALYNKGSKGVVSFINTLTELIVKSREISDKKDNDEFEDV